MRKTAWLLAVIVFFGLFTTLSADISAYTPNVEVFSEAVYMINLDTDTVIYEKNQHERRYPASLTKIMTSILVFEMVDDLDETTVTAYSGFDSVLYGLNASSAGIRAGETYTMRELIYCMMLQSANEAALLVADYLGNGSRDAFYAMMNQRAEELGCLDTHFANPNGLFHEDHYTTAYDMALISKHAISIPGFEEIYSSTRYRMEGNDDHLEKTLITTIKLMEQGTQYYNKNVRGLKTGTLDESGRCLSTTASKDGLSYLLVMLGAPIYDETGTRYDRNLSFVDANNLFGWAFSTFSIKQLLSSDEPIAQVGLELVWDRDYLLLTPKESFSALVANDIDPSSVQLLVTTDSSVKAPVTNGSVLGKVDLVLAGEKLGQVDLIATEDVERSALLFFVENLQEVFRSVWFKVGLAVLVILLMIYILLMLRYNKRRRRYSYKSYKPNTPRRGRRL